MESDRELILEEAASIREAMRRMVRYTSEATESLDRRIEAGSLDGRTEAEELRGALERVQALTVDVSEELDASNSDTPASSRFHALITGVGARRVELARA